MSEEEEKPSAGEEDRNQSSSEQCVRGNLQERVGGFGILKELYSLLITKNIHIV